MFQADSKFSQNYLEILKSRYEGLNLTRIADENAFHVEHFLDSTSPLQESKRFQEALKKKKLLVDVGFGGGFPILPLADQCREEKFVGIESKAKKVAAVADIAVQMGIANTCFFHHRIEEVFIDLPCVLTFRAVGSIASMVKELSLGEECELYFYKGPRFQEQEGEEFLALEAGGDWEVVEDVSFRVEYLSRRFIGLLNHRFLSTKKVEGKNLVNLSSLL